MIDDVAALSLVEILQGLRSRAFSAVELVSACEVRTRSAEYIRAFARETFTQALDAAALSDEARSAGRSVGQLEGIPIALKDGFLTRGVETGAGSRALSGYIPEQDAEIWRRLAAEGALLAGKTTMHEFAYGTASIPTVNPWDPTRSPGGSSGGSAAAVAARMVPVAFGTDTGGSLRIPAAACGVATLRSASGGVPRSGIIALSPTLDVAGPIVRRLLDLPLLMTVVTGRGYRVRPREDLHGIRIGVPRQMSWDHVEASGVATCEAALARLVARGAELVQIDTPEQARKVLYGKLSVFDAINRREAYRLNRRLGDWLKHPIDRSRLTPQVRDLLDSGADIRLMPYGLARARRVAWRTTWHRLMRSKALDVIAHPTLTKSPPVIDPDRPWKGPNILQSVPWSLASFSALSVPVGLDRNTMPVGLSLAAPGAREHCLLELGVTLDEEIGFWRLSPPLRAPRVWPAGDG